MSQVRLDKYLVSQGICSRSEAKLHCRRGDVTVNNRSVRDSSQKIDTSDRVVFCGEPVLYAEHLYIMLNKPKGVISATEDPAQRTVTDLLPETWQRRGIFPVGRLDKDTEGLLLLTDDGKWAHRITAPKKKIFKTYMAEVEGCIPENINERFQAGILLEDGYACAPGFAEPVQENRIKIQICEGKFHQVKRMCKAVGLTVVGLERVRIGELALDAELKRGEYRLLCAEEVAIF